jgi:hypothetical protein
VDAEYMWNFIVECLKKKSRDISTVPSNNRKPVWFYAYIENDNIFVENSTTHFPPTDITGRREIEKKDFLTVYGYFEPWLNDRSIRQEVRSYSRNTAYIFGLIDHFKSEVKNIRPIL